MKNNGIILIFGITGDLSKRKLIPGIYRLLVAGKLQQTRLIGAAIDNKTIDQVLEGARPFINDLDPVIWQKLVAKFSYCQVDINNQADFVKLADLVKSERQKNNLADQILVYCAVFEALYIQLTARLAQVGLVKKGREVRVVYEKPFGHSYQSVHDLNQAILEFLNEEQVYRVDHYLAKEIVGNIAFVRFTNRIFEPLWNSQNIESIQITLDESLDVEGRGSYYERYGVIKDVVQNHILQLIALIAMGTPKSLTGSAMQDAKAAILKNIKCTDGLLGQYAGYLAELNVNPGSQVPTFAQLKFIINDQRWAGVPFYVRTGKVMPNKKTKVVIKFKDTHCLLPKNCSADSSNLLTISIYPKSGFELELNAKKTGVNDEIMPIKMGMCCDSSFVAQAPCAYENVISEVMAGDTYFAVRMDEIESAWTISDQIEALNLPLYIYQKGSIGPKELAAFNQKHQLVWK